MFLPPILSLPHANHTALFSTFCCAAVTGLNSVQQSTHFNCPTLYLQQICLLLQLNYTLKAMLQMLFYWTKTAVMLVNKLLTNDRTQAAVKSTFSTLCVCVLVHQKTLWVMVNGNYSCPVLLTFF